MLPRPGVPRHMDPDEAVPSPPAFRHDWRAGCTVTVVTKSGARYTSTVDAPRGSGPRGISWTDVDAKFRALTRDAGVSTKRVEQTLALIHRFDQVRHVSELTRLLS